MGMHYLLGCDLLVLGYLIGSPVICDNGITEKSYQQRHDIVSVQNKVLISGVNALLRVKYLNVCLQAQH